jgi:hypothetical protein
LEAQIRQLLTDKDSWASLQERQGKTHNSQLESFKDENEKLKRQIFTIDKQRT